MYDLKTASRLYVLEGHKRALAAITFSPDGRRLVTVSFEEGVFMVWKVGASFSNFFSLPGAPPKQGGSTGSEPYKVFPITLPESESNVPALLRVPKLLLSQIQQRQRTPSAMCLLSGQLHEVRESRSARVYLHLLHEWSVSNRAVLQSAEK